MKRAAPTLVIFLCLAFTAAAAFNVFSDNTEVEQLARTVACRDEGPGCAPTLTRLARTPFGQSMQFSTPRKSMGIRCSRSLLLVGPHECSRE